MSLDDPINVYLRSDSDTKENANNDRSASGLESFIADHYIKQYVLRNLYPSWVGKMHKDGDLYVHNLTKGLLPYCFGGDLYTLLTRGMLTERIVSKPAKHLNTAVDHIVNFMCINQQEWAGAQALSHVNTLLAPFVRYDHLTYGEVYQNIQRLIWNLNYPWRSGYQCVSEDTLILTNNGWKSMESMLNDPTNKVLTFNMETKTLEYLTPKHVVKYKYTGELVHIYNNMTDQLVTPNHRVITYQSYSNTPQIELAEDLLKHMTPILVPVSGDLISEDAEISDDELRLWAWILAEGSIRYSENGSEITICKSVLQDDSMDSIEDLLTSMNINWTGLEYDYRFNLALEKFIEFFMSLSRRQAILFLREYGKVDRSKDYFILYAKDEYYLKMIQALCVIAGYTSSAVKRSYGVYEIFITSEFADRMYARVESVEYDGYVWCVESDNQTMVTMRDNKIAITGNTVFSNLIFDFYPSKYFINTPVVVGGEITGDSYEDFIDEMDMIHKAYWEIMNKGDVVGNVFTFPIPTVSVTKKTNWDSDLINLIIENTVKRGQAFWMNYDGTGIDEDTILSMCCHLNIALDQLAPAGGRWAYEGGTGSIGVVTLNLGRIGYLAKNDSELFELLGDYMDRAIEILLFKQDIVRASRDNLGLMPTASKYEVDFDRFFRTIGFIGLDEMMINFTGTPISDNLDLSHKVLLYMSKRALEYQQKYGILVNIEETPAEGSSYSIATKDRARYQDIYTRGEPGSWYYSALIPPSDEELELYRSIEIAERLLPELSGGTVYRVNVGETEPSIDSMRKFVMMISKNTRIPYFDMNATYSICQKCGTYMRGERSSCTNCDASVDQIKTFTRTVGYYREITKFNNGKLNEYRNRKYRNI